MKISLLVVLLFLLSSCQKDVEEKYYDDPILGKRFPATSVNIDGWDISTINNGKTLIISKDKENIVGIYVVDKERSITVFSPSDPLGVVQLTDQGEDSIYEAITYGNGNVQVTDIGLDGSIDGVLNLGKKEMLVNFEGKLYLMNEGPNDRYITVDNKNIPMIYKHNTYVPK